jgi:hypothetical protein
MGVVGLCKNSVHYSAHRVQCTQSLTHQYIQSVTPSHSPLTASVVAGYSRLHSKIFGNFLTRLAFALASNFLYATSAELQNIHVR